MVGVGIYHKGVSYKLNRRMHVGHTIINNRWLPWANFDLYIFVSKSVKSQ